MYKNILVAVEPTHAEKHEQALKMAMNLGEDVNSEITALTVIEPMPIHLAAVDESGEQEKVAGQNAMAALRKFVGPL